LAIIKFGPTPYKPKPQVQKPAILQADARRKFNSGGKKEGKRRKFL
jgi:hypothetical protein